MIKKLRNQPYAPKSEEEEEKKKSVSPVRGTSSIDWAQLSRLHLKTETESSLRNAVFTIKTGQWIMSRNTVIVLINHRHRLSYLTERRSTTVTRFCPQDTELHAVLTTFSSCYKQYFLPRNTASFYILSNSTVILPSNAT
jgi:hypothetical protein